MCGVRLCWPWPAPGGGGTAGLGATWAGTRRWGNAGESHSTTNHQPPAAPPDLQPQTAQQRPHAAVPLPLAEPVGHSVRNGRERAGGLNRRRYTAGWMQYGQQHLHQDWLDAMHGRPGTLCQERYDMVAQLQVNHARRTGGRLPLPLDSWLDVRCNNG